MFSLGYRQNQPHALMNYIKLYINYILHAAKCDTRCLSVLRYTGVMLAVGFT